MSKKTKRTRATRDGKRRHKMKRLSQEVNTLRTKNAMLQKHLEALQKQLGKSSQIEPMSSCELESELEKLSLTTSTHIDRVLDLCGIAC
jgi:uncharacterized protein YlxW (UPF0749 family)